LLGCVMTGTLGAADVPFIGKWKLNPSKSELTDEMKIEPAGENKYTLTLPGMPAKLRPSWPTEQTSPGSLGLHSQSPSKALIPGRRSARKTAARCSRPSGSLATLAKRSPTHLLAFRATVQQSTSIRRTNGR